MGIKQNREQDHQRGKHAKPPVSSPYPRQQHPSSKASVPHPRPTGSSSNASRSSFKPAAPAVPASRKRNKTSAIACACVIAVLVAAYAATALYFSGHCLPNTKLGDEDVSFMSVDEVASTLDDIASSYSVEVTGDGLSFQVSASDAGATIESDRIAEEIVSDANPVAWPLGFFTSRDMTSRISITTGDSGMADKIRGYVEEFNSTAQPSSDAYISYDESESKFEVVPEVYGSTIDAEAVVNSVDQAIRSLDRNVVIDDTHLVKPTVLSNDPSLSQACSQANTMVSSRLEFLVSGTSVATLDASTIANWVVLNDDLSVVLDENQVQSWVDSVAGQINTYGSTRTYTRPDGKECTVKGGVYGWIVDNAAFKTNVVDYVSSGTVGTYDVPMTQTAASFEGVGKQDWGSRYVDVDLVEQHAVFYDNGSVIWESDIVSGKPDGEHDTPSGIYLVNGKQSPSTLIGSMEPETGKPEYETEVQYWMPFVGNSVGFHDANWQSAFGGSRYAEGYGSHGCVNLPVDAASQLYSVLNVGDIVVVHS